MNVTNLRSWYDVFFSHLHRLLVLLKKVTSVRLSGPRYSRLNYTSSFPPTVSHLLQAEPRMASLTDMVPMTQIERIGE